MSSYSAGFIMLWCGSHHVMLRVASSYGDGCIMLWCRLRHILVRVASCYGVGQSFYGAGRFVLGLGCVMLF